MILNSVSGIVGEDQLQGSDGRGPDWLVMVTGLLDGRAAATFVVLAGTGLSLLTKKARTLGDRGLRAGSSNSA